MKRSLLFVSLFLALTCTGSSSESKADLSGFTQKQVSRLKRLRSCSYSAEIIGRGMDPGVSESVRLELKYCEMGGRFSMEAKSSKGSSPARMSFRSAYNGKIFQNLNFENEDMGNVLFVSSNRMIGMPEISMSASFGLWEPFRFVLPNADRELRGKNSFFTFMPTAEDLVLLLGNFKKAKYIGTELRMGRLCQVLEYPTQGNFFVPHGGSFKVFFAEDLDGYPISYELFDEDKKMVVSYSCNDIGEVKGLDEERFFYPKSSEFKLFKNGNVVTITTKISEMKVNQVIPDSVFFIDPKDADRIEDVDKRKKDAAPETRRA